MFHELDINEKAFPSVTLYTHSMSGNPFLQSDSLGSVASRNKTIVRKKYIAREPSQDYFEPSDENVHGDFSEFEGKNHSRYTSFQLKIKKLKFFFFIS